MQCRSGIIADWLSNKQKGPPSGGPLGPFSFRASRLWARMARAVVAEERAGCRIVGLVPAGAVRGCVAAVRAVRWIARSVGDRGAVVIRTVVIWCSQRTANDGTAKEAGAKAPAESAAPYRHHIGYGRVLDRKRVGKWHCRSRTGSGRGARQRGGDQHVEHSSGHCP